MNQLSLDFTPRQAPAPTRPTWLDDDNDDLRRERRAARFDRQDAQDGSHLGALNQGKHLLR